MRTSSAETAMMFLICSISNDSMPCGSGKEIFCFCDYWGDTVEQLASGSVTLRFNSGSELNWNTQTMTYIEKGNSVSVSGVALENISLKFGDDGSFQYANLLAKGAFDASFDTSIFKKRMIIRAPAYDALGSLKRQ